MLPQFSLLFHLFLEIIYAFLLVLDNFVIQKLNFRLLRNFKGIMKIFSINHCSILKDRFLSVIKDTNHSHKIHLFNTIIQILFFLVCWQSCEYTTTIYSWNISSAPQKPLQTFPFYLTQLKPIFSSSQPLIYFIEWHILNIS